MTRFPILVLCSAILAACTTTRPATAPTPVRPAVVPRLVPLPTSLTTNSGSPFVLTNTTSIAVDPGNAEVARTAELLALVLRPSTGFAIPISTGATIGAIVLRLSPNAALGAEGYQLTSSRDSVRITANAPAGLFHGTQTLRQLLPPQIESQLILSPMSWTVPAVTISDSPRYAYRGAMLDVARHFFTPRELKQYIDLLALYKLNMFHIHLADDQGWRIEIKSRPKLTAM